MGANGGSVNWVCLLLIHPVGSRRSPDVFVLRALGYVEGKTIITSAFWPKTPSDLPELAAALVKRNLEVIVAPSSSAVAALKRVTQTIPIVFATTADPVGSGFVANLRRPGGNIAAGRRNRRSADEPGVRPRERACGVGAEREAPDRERRPRLRGCGGLMAYGVDYDDQMRGAATYVDRILKGASPGDLPVRQPSRVQLVINLKTARALGLTISPSLLAQADQRIS
jgi:hypothetical protein